MLEDVVSLVFTIGLKTDLVALLGPYFGKIIKGLRDRYIGSLFRVDEPVPDDSGWFSGLMSFSSRYR